MASVLAFDELNRLERIKKHADLVPDFYELYQLGKDIGKRYAGDHDSIIDFVSSFLIAAYRRGVEAAGEMLAAKTSPNIAEMNASIYMTIGGKTFEDRIRDGSDPGVLLETESHRVFNEGILDGARQTDDPGVLKTWVTMRDDRVRETHEYIDSVTIPLGERFTTIDGDSALAPGGFSRAENNVNCRCWIDLS